MIYVRETSNQHNPYAVVAVKDTVIVGRVPRKISALCSPFLKQGGTLSCRVDGGRRYSVDLPQGELEIPCTLIFTTEEQSSIDKLRKLLKQVDVVVSLVKEKQKEEKQEQEEKKKPEES